jgi:hypothetical protein
VRNVTDRRQFAWAVGASYTRFDFSRQPLESKEMSSQWTWKQTVAEQVMDIVNARQSPRFSLDDIYYREADFHERLPSNRHVREKIRQMLQRLRDLGVLTFLGNREYLLNPGFEDLELVPADRDDNGWVVPGTQTVVRTVRLRNTVLATHIKRQYDNLCQVCRETIPLKDRNYSEAHHLKPLGSPHFGPDIEGNIIVVCPNHHVMFDQGAVWIDPETLVISPCPQCPKATPALPSTVA